MLARLPLRSKLILVVSVPLFVILGFAGFGIAQRLGDLEGQRQYGRLRLPNDALTGVQRTLEREGVLTTWFVAAPDADGVGDDLDDARDATDRARTALRAAGRDLADDDVAARTTRAWQRLEARLDDLGTLRRQADDAAGLPPAFAARYGTLVDDAIDVSARLARDVDDRQLADSMVGVVALRRAQAAAADEAMVVLPYLAAGTSSNVADWVAARADQAEAIEGFVAGASSEERAAYDRARRGVPEDPFRAAVGSDPSTFPAVSVTPTEYFAAWSERQARTSSGIDAVQRVVDRTAASLEADALRGVLGFGLGIAALVLAVLVLAWTMIRSVNRSLRSLTDAARDVAEHQLPNLVETLQRGGEPTPVETIPPITVESPDEIGALARAFNTIQETTVRVAEEQGALLRKGIGDLYVNLARRNQSLVDRQIALLDTLEARAEDPDQLASLFELDHLATRMRRNAESLLVLSGAGPGRQWADPIPILDVVRAASGEIADFARVSAVGFEGDVAVTGNAVADVTHILAELLENATAFSPPGTPVVVAGMLAEQRFVVSITDEGIGMDDERLAAANALLQHPPPPGLSLSRTLGLHVVAHLAARYGVRVQLRRSATNGVTAIVALPASVLTRAGDRAPSGTPGTSEPSEPVSAATVSWTPSAPAPAAPPAPPPAAPSRPPAGAPAFSAPPPDPGQFLAPPVGEPVVVGSAATATIESPVPGPSADADLPRRPASGGPADRPDAGSSLPTRDPGRHLSYRPDAAAPGPGRADGAARPQRVHDLLTRHLGGIRDGRERSVGGSTGARPGGEGEP